MSLRLARLLGQTHWQGEPLIDEGTEDGARWRASMGIDTLWRSIPPRPDPLAPLSRALERLDAGDEAAARRTVALWRLAGGGNNHQELSTPTHPRPAQADLARCRPPAPEYRATIAPLLPSTGCRPRHLCSTASHRGHPSRSETLVPGGTAVRPTRADPAIDANRSTRRGFRAMVAGYRRSLEATRSVHSPLRGL